MHGRSWRRQCPQFKDCAERSTPTPVKGCAEREAGWHDRTAFQSPSGWLLLKIGAFFRKANRAVAFGGRVCGSPWLARPTRASLLC